MLIPNWVESIMKLLKSVMSSYFHGIVFFIIVFYFMTAKPSGAISLSWNPVNTVWTVSFLLAYPLFRILFPKITRINIHMKSLRSQSLNMDDGHTDSLSDMYHAATNPIMNRLDMKSYSNSQDDGLNLIVNFLLSGVFITISIPGLFILLLKTIFMKIRRSFK